MRSRQWYLDSMQAQRIWETSTGKGITVAVIDSGVDSSVPELQGQLLAGTDFSDDQHDANYDSEGHGTSMAMIIAGQRKGDHAWGLAPGSKILPIRSGNKRWSFHMAKSIRYATDHGAKVINISWAGTPTEESRVDLQPAIEYANKNGLLIFAGSGNDGDKGNPAKYPASLPGVVGVGAVDKSLKVAKFSTYGPQVALAAPGVDIPTRCTKELFDCVAQGTSNATAIASASAALIWSAHPTWTNNQVLRVMMQTAGKPEDGKVPSKYLGYGIVRPRKVLVDKEGDPGPADVNPLLAAHREPAPSGTARSRESGDNNKATGTAPESDSFPKWPLVAGGGVAALAVILGGLLIARRKKTQLSTHSH
ncbi:type VII secretion-associated serine protease mycosin [Streptomyces noursei]|uniref:type VII secretion-associated serine protease mycosin n=2 Tax=Streptomyces noursei TaxID=1971 RepID=UPI0033F815FB